MNGIAVLVALTAVGVDYGWEPSADGQLEYIIQIEPELLESLKGGASIVSAIHPDARDVRKVRIQVGTGPLPRKGTLQGQTTPTRLSTSASGGAEYGAPASGTIGSGAASEAAAGSARTGPEYDAEGFLRLPPPPLLDMDGKTSVLVRPGSRATISSDDPNPTGLSTIPSLDRIAPPEPPTSGIAGPPSSGFAAPADRGRLSPPAGSSFPLHNNSVPALPTAPNSWGTPNGSGTGNGPDDAHPVQPVPGPSRGDDPPSPIIGAVTSEVLPPSFDSLVDDRAVTSPDSATGENDRRSEVLPPTTHDSTRPSAWETATTDSPKTAADSSTPSPSDHLNSLASADGPDAALQKPTLDPETAEELNKPWRTLVLTSMALFASLAANCYLGWVAIGIYRRYREVVAQLHRFQASLT